MSLFTKARALVGLPVDGIEQERLPFRVLLVVAVAYVVGHVVMSVVTDSNLLRSVGRVAVLVLALGVAQRWFSSRGARPSADTSASEDG